MGKYNASNERFDRTRMACALAAGLLVALTAGCAGDSTSEAVATPPPVVEAAPPPPDDANANVTAVNDINQATAAAGDLSLRNDAPLHYRVKKGDTLWGISNYFLRDPWQWPALWYTNGQIANPHLIYPGEILTLVMVNGRPRLTLAEDRLHPRIRTEDLDNAIPAIPIDAIREFLRGPRLITKDESQHAPYVVEFTDEAIIAGQNNGIYVKNLPNNGVPDWALVKVGSPYKDPDSGELLGYEAIPTGEAELRNWGEASEMMLTKSPQEVTVGNRLLPLEPESFKADFYPHPPKTQVDGTILTVYGGMDQIAQYDIVSINRGSRDGLDPGTVLSIYQRGRAVSDPYGSGKVKLPEQKAGVVMVFKVTERLSYALVMSETRGAHVLDKVRKPVATPRYSAG
jgi:hypothetical protein